MTIEYTGRHTEVPQPLKALAERKLRKLSRALPGITHVHVILSVDKHRKIAEVSIHSRNLDLTASQATSDLATSLTTVIDKLTRQAQRRRGIRERKRRAAPRSAPTPSPEPPERAELPRVIRSRRFLVKPMTVDEAVREVGQSREGLVVFRDATTERVTVLYKRKDGNFGLIEPEA